MPLHDYLYRICDQDQWQASLAAGELAWSALDRRDGFVHLSCAAQVGATLARYFAGRTDLRLLTLASERLVDGSLRFERPRTGPGEAARREPYPHFYGRIGLEAIVANQPLDLDADGRHRLPPAVVEASVAERDDFEALAIRVAWDPRHSLALIEYPKPARIDDEAAIYAWEAQLERRLSGLVERGGGKVPAVIGLDNLRVAAKVERRYVELADKLISRCFTRVARWASDERVRRFFAAANGARSLPSEVFERREDAIAFVLAARPGALVGARAADSTADVSILRE